ncbi:hypothetical protein AAFN60_01910 [Roseibacillus persicicus]|uniref:hypothetical protein n=1 Tax=Roseibacillus persicicus TaxID=454148 RepID=UPI00398B925F
MSKFITVPRFALEGVKPLPFSLFALKRKEANPFYSETEVKAALAIRGWSQARLAKEIGRSAPVVNQAIKRGSNMGTVRLIADALQLEVKEVSA